MKTAKIVLPLVLAALGACKETKPPAEGTATATATAAASTQAPKKPDVGMFAALPANADSKDMGPAERLTLGKMLYFDKRLSKNHDVSCNSCHNLDTYGVDNKKTSEGHKKQLGGRNSPTVYNAALHFKQFWDGRAADVEEQATGPVMNPVEMAMPSEKRLVETLASIADYKALFEKAFPGEKEPISLKNAGRAIAAYERKLLTPSRFDRYLKGDEKALSDDEVKGLQAFVGAGCTACHSGAAVGGAMYQKLGLVKPWPETKDGGRFEVTKQEGDKMMFKVPGLRNIEKTAPYFHDGSVATLEEAIKLMGKHQLGRDLSEAEVKSIATFLKTLTGEPPKELIKAPELPKSGDKTPKPDPA